jgi:hypothetical protein
MSDLQEEVIINREQQADWVADCSRDHLLAKARNTTFYQK